MTTPAPRPTVSTSEPGHVSPTVGRKGNVFVGWITSTDHKTIGYMYLITSFVYFLIGGVLALVIRVQLFAPGLEVVATTCNLLAVAALALETAEAAAEWLHHHLREQWGFPDPPETSAQDRFAGRYHGKRYSFGYPACPDLGCQRQLFEALLEYMVTRGY